jgi:hypothetical protein
MGARRFLQTYVASWDAAGAVTALVVCAILTPSELDTGFLASLLSVSVGALSIIFAVYFSALTMITASGGDEFIQFLELHGHLLVILRSFKTTLVSLFLALVYSLGAYACMALLDSRGTENVPRWVLLVYTPLAAYSLISACLMAFDSMKFAKERARFFRMDEEKRRKYIEQLRRSQSNNTPPPAGKAKSGTTPPIG